ncbi:MAG TPA: hypothetical protein VG733_02370 [Chthoniobacteraceae bacterium]|nr:hypothetical protein [Chthoniobacteraceae bacterium]
MNIAIVPTDPGIDLNEVTRVSAALQKQVTNNFASWWGYQADINCFTRIEDVPQDSAIIQLVIGTLLSDPSLEGYHYFDDRNEPHALVRVDQQNWSLTASHECLEMLADPGGTLTINAPPIGQSMGTVTYLKEVCDPCQNISYGYCIDNYPVSDFYGPNYFDAVATPGARYSITGSLPGPRTILPGGYLCFRDETGTWMKAVSIGGQIQISTLPPGSVDAKGSLREKIDAHSKAGGLADIFKDLGGEHTLRVSNMLEKIKENEEKRSLWATKRKKILINFKRKRKRPNK